MSEVLTCRIDVKLFPVDHASIFRFVYERCCKHKKRDEILKECKYSLSDLTTDPSIISPIISKSLLDLGLLDRSKGLPVPSLWLEQTDVSFRLSLSNLVN